jgi:hypothetical protein
MTVLSGSASFFKKTQKRAKETMERNKEMKMMMEEEE